MKIILNVSEHLCWVAFSLACSVPSLRAAVGDCHTAVTVFSEEGSEDYSEASS